MNQRFQFDIRLRLLFGIAGGVLAALVAASWYAALEMEETTRQMARTHEVSDRLDDIRADTLLIELYTMHFRLTGDEGRLTAREAAFATREVALRRIRELTADNPAQQARWESLRAVVDERLAIYRRIDRLRQTEGAATANAYAAVAPLDETRARLHATLREMDDEEYRLLAERSAEQTRARNLRHALSAFSVLLLLALLAFTYVMVRRQLAERRQVEATLRDSEESLSTTLHSIGDAVLATDTAGRVVRMNPVAERYTGWPLGEARGRPVAEVFRIVNEQTRAPAEAPVARVLATGEVHGLANHTLLIARDGTEWPIADSAAPILDADGVVSGVVLVFHDVTIERAAEKTIREQNALLEQRVFERTAQLRDSEARFRLLVDGARDYAIVMLDPQGRVLTWNEGARRLKGFASEEIVGQPIARFYPAEDVAAGKPARLLAQAAAEGRAEDEGWRLRRDGTRFFANVVITAIRDPAGELLGFAKVTRDISEQKRMETLLHEEKSVLELIGTGAPLAQVLDAIARNVESLAPDALNSILLLGPDGIHVKHGAAPSLPEDYVRAIDGAPIGPQAGSCGTAMHRGERVIVADIANDPLWADYAPLALRHGLLACSSTPVRSAGGKVLGAFALYYREPRTPSKADFDLIEQWTHITGIAIERAQAEEAIHDLNKNLERRVAERTAQLEEASRAKSDFLANMSHELRTPLNAIIGFSEMLRDGVLGELEEKQRGFVADIFDAGTHLLSLINDILDLAKVEAGMLRLDAEAVDLPALLQASTLIVREKALSHRIRLDTRLDPSLDTLLADERKLKQIVYNLLSNAVKFTPEGGTVTLSARRCTRAEVADDPARPTRLIPLPQSADREFVAITVEDSGVGIAEADLAKLYEPFTQVDSSVARRHAGTGLGLSLVRRLAELHGGTVGVASRPGEGSRFCVWLPYREPGQKSGQEGGPNAAASLAAAPEAAAGLPPPPAPPAVPLALVIEDDDRMAELIAAQLHEEGFAVMRAATAEEGLARAAKRRPQLITLDIFLPHMDGWEFMERLRADPRLAATPVVIITVSNDLHRGLSLVARRVLHKPFSRDELVIALAGLVDARPDGSPARVLVVDDKVKAVELLATMLEAEGCRVLRAYGGAEAIAAAKSALPDLVILDLMMPGVNGFEVADALRETEATARIPILILTAKDLTAADHAALNGKVQKVLGKTGFNAKALRAELQRALPGRAKD